MYYLCKPDLYSVCKIFGHKSDRCHSNVKLDKPVVTRKERVEKVNKNEVLGVSLIQTTEKSDAGFSDQLRKLPKTMSLRSNKLARVLMLKE